MHRIYKKKKVRKKIYHLIRVHLPTQSTISSENDGDSLGASVDGTLLSVFLLHQGI